MKSDIKDEEYLDGFESKLEKELLSICTSHKMLDGVLLTSGDIDELWENIANEYIADAAKEMTDYPGVAISWAAYLGMAVASGWDRDWESCKKMPYKDYYGPNGFDDMDDHIVTDILHIELGSPESVKINDNFLSCSETAISIIRHEKIEPQSVMSFYVFSRTVKTMFRIGASIQLYRMGYKFERIDQCRLS